MIKKFNVATPGRGAGRLADETKEDKEEAKANPHAMSAKAKKVVQGFGG